MNSIYSLVNEMGLGQLLLLLLMLTAVIMICYVAIRQICLGIWHLFKWAFGAKKAKGYPSKYGRSL